MSISHISVFFFVLEFQNNFYRLILLDFGQLYKVITNPQWNHLLIYRNFYGWEMADRAIVDSGKLCL